MIDVYITYGKIPLVVLADTEEQKMMLLDNLFKETYISDIVKRNKIRNAREMEALLDVLASAIGALTNPNKLQKTFKSVKHVEGIYLGGGGDYELCKSGKNTIVENVRNRKRWVDLIPCKAAFGKSAGRFSDVSD